MKTKAMVGLVLQTVLGLGLILFGWGFDDLRGFFAHPARAGFIAVGVLSLIWALAARLEVQPFRRGTRPVGRQRLGLAVVIGLALFLGWFFPYADRRGLLTFAGADALRYLGLALCAAGSAVAFVALHALGKQYSGYVTLQDEHQLVQSGIYAAIRHPIYLRGLMLALGWPLVFRSWLALPLPLVVAVFVGLRMRQEERLLAEQFGAEFDAYQRRTWRLIPHVF
jgi:protein-S-isoprenylcysteine O-methyltransferase Ste14